ncbi:MAG: hypothetical protein U9Q69_01365 [Nanoarchaeota archaeon]|nr:hypothetical protein [Nanoarchaeota archaeon]
MVKLNEKRIKWLVDQVIECCKKPSEVASVYGLSVRRVRQIVQVYKETGKMGVQRSEGKF